MPKEISTHKVNIFSATNNREDVMRVWHQAINKNFTIKQNLTIVTTQKNKFGQNVKTVNIEHMGLMVPFFIMRKLFIPTETNIYIEEDIIAVRKWSLEDYPGALIMLEAQPGNPWPGIVIARSNVSTDNTRALIKQTPIESISDCPYWLPKHLHQPAVEARAQIVGNHFLHIDRMSRSDVDPELMIAKNKLLSLLSIYLSNTNTEYESELLPNNENNYYKEGILVQNLGLSFSGQKINNQQKNMIKNPKRLPYKENNIIFSVDGTLVELYEAFSKQMECDDFWRHST